MTIQVTRGASRAKAVDLRLLDASSAATSLSLNQLYVVQLEFWRGTRPSQAANLRPLRKPLGSVIVAAIAAARKHTGRRPTAAGDRLCAVAPFC